jgi:predicted ABC-type ATPase
MTARITVLAGVNGAGKSSVAGESIIQSGGEYYNPDIMTRSIMEKRGASLYEANSEAWQKGKDALERAIASCGSFTFETTLGGNTITEILLHAAEEKKAEIHLLFVGLSSVELYIKRVKQRVSQGGHDIPEDKIRSRYTTSPQNLIRLIPFLSSLYVYDNSASGDPTPAPIKLAYVDNNEIKHMANREQIADWAKPIITTIMKL